MQRWNLPPKLVDCRLHGAEAGSELFVVEGDSAAAAVAAIRDPMRQAVLPLQGKPLNAVRASPARVAADPFLGALHAALGVGPADACRLDALRYERVLLLHDPDADGIHIGALLLMYAATRLAPLLEAGRLERVHAPLGEVSGAEGGAPELAFGEAHFRALCERARERSGAAFVARRHRGLGGIGPQALRVACVDPATRMTTVLGPEDARLAAAVFGAGPGSTRRRGERAAA
jgi:DNA gyrase subunit B